MTNLLSLLMYMTLKLTIIIMSGKQESKEEHIENLYIIRIEYFILALLIFAQTMNNLTVFSQFKFLLYQINQMLWDIKIFFLILLISNIFLSVIYRIL